MNWSKILIWAMVAFVLYMMYFLYQAIANSSEKVPDKYYEKGIAYQETINAKKAGIASGVDMGFKSDKGAFFVQNDSMVLDSGTLYLQWSPDEKYNRREVFTRMDKGRHFVAHSGPNGYWNMRFVFWYGGLRAERSKKVWAE